MSLTIKYRPERAHGWWLYEDGASLGCRSTLWGIKRFRRRVRRARVLEWLCNGND